MLVRNPVFEERVEMFERLFTTTKWKRRAGYGGGGDGYYFIFTDSRGIRYRVPNTENGKVYDFTKPVYRTGSYALDCEYKFPTFVI